MFEDVIPASAGNPVVAVGNPVGKGWRWAKDLIIERMRTVKLASLATKTYWRGCVRWVVAASSP